MAAPTFVLVPGAGGDAWGWHLVVAELERRGRAAVAVDLPGDDPRAGLPEYADLVVAAARDLGRVVLVGQSLGGFSASLACPRLDVAELVLVNAMVPAPGETAGEWWEAVGHAQAMRDEDLRAGRDPDDPDLTARFLHDVPDELVAQSLARGRGEDAAVFAAAWDLDAWPAVPTRVLAGRDDRFFPVALQRRVARERLGLDVTLVPGGHVPALSRPVELVDALLRSA